MRATASIAAIALVGMLATDAAAVEVTSAHLSLGVVDEDYDAHDFATRTHLGLRLRTARSQSGVSAEAAISLHVALSPSLISFSDNSSFVQLRWQPATWGDTEGLKLTLLPLSSTRQHLGYEYAATWARRPFGASGSIPAVDLRLERERWYGFAALRFPSGINNATHESERLVTWFTGGGLDVLPVLRIEATAMHSDDGVIPLSSVLSQRVRATGVGVSGRLLLHQGAPIGPSVDLALYGADPELYERLFAPDSYPEQVSYSLSLEAGNRNQTLASPDHFGEIVDENAQVFALQGRLKTGRLRVHALGMYRSALLPLFDLYGGFTPYQALSEDSSTLADVLLSGGVDYHFSGLGVTPGLMLAVEWPATIERSPFPGGVNPPPGLADPVLVVGPKGISLLPRGQTRQPILSAKATLRWDIAEVATLLAEASWTRDDNRTTFRDSVEGGIEPIAAPARILGLAAMLQARF